MTPIKRSARNFIPCFFFLGCLGAEREGERGEAVLIPSHISERMLVLTFSTTTVSHSPTLREIDTTKA